MKNRELDSSCHILPQYSHKNASGPRSCSFACFVRSALTLVAFARSTPNSLLRAAVMLSHSSTWVPLGLLLLGVKRSFGHGMWSTLVKYSRSKVTNIQHKDHHPHSTIDDLWCTSNVTVIDTTTIISSTTLPVTRYVDVTIPYYVNVTVSSTETSTVSTCVTESTTTTLHYTISTTETKPETITNTRTTTATVPATITTYTTQTMISTTVDPCPNTCSMYVPLRGILMTIRS